MSMHTYYGVVVTDFLWVDFNVVRTVHATGLAVDSRDIRVPVHVTYLSMRISLYTIRVPCGRHNDIAEYDFTQFIRYSNVCVSYCIIDSLQG